MRNVVRWLQSLGRGTGHGVRILARGWTLIRLLQVARARARAQRRPELVLYGLLLAALLLGIELDVGRRLGGVLFLALLIPLHVFARRKAAAAAASAVAGSRKE